MTAGAYVAIDWGTTNRRIFLLDAEGQLLATKRDGLGVLALTPDRYPDEIAAIRSRYGKIPIVAAGMIGSTRGWRDVPYVGLPAGCEELAAGALRLAGDVTIIPGIALYAAQGCDVMRGEEIQALGAVGSGLAPSDALFCHPGTHNKWITVDGGRITDFVTAMTGEIFALLRDRSALSEMMKGQVADTQAFRDGVKEILLRPERLLTALFGVRAASVLGRRPVADGAAFASGLLIGSDVASHVVEKRTIHIVSESPLGPLYAAAIAECGGKSKQIDGCPAFVAGIHSIWRALA